MELTDEQKADEKIQRIKEKIKESGISQKRLSFWITVERKVIGYSEADISYLLNKTRGISLLKLKNLESYLDEYSLENESAVPINSLLSSKGLISKREPLVTQNFIKEHIINATNRPIQVDILGIVNLDLKTSLESLVDEGNLPFIKIRVLMLSPDGLAVRQRAILEGAAIDTMQKELGAAYSDFSVFRKQLISLRNKSSLEIKKYDFLPPFKLIRINNYVLVSPYLNGKGYLSPYMVCQKNIPPNVFEKYLNYFEFIFSNKAHLSTLQIRRPFEIRSGLSTASFIENEFKRLQKEQTEIMIDCVGMKLAAVVRTFISLINDDKLPRIKARFVICHPDKSGLGFRKILEKKDSKKNIEVNLDRIIDLKKRLVAYNNSTLDVRLLHPDPNTYIVRINDAIYVSPYYANDGYDTHYDIYRKEESPRFYKKNFNLLRAYFVEDGLSEPLL